jgi:short-subunit dehydrogenase
MKTENKVIAVTGGGNGIGRELVLHLVQKGAKVAAIDIDPDGLAETQTLAGEQSNRISLHVADITDLQAVAALPKAIQAQQGAIDGLINNAGIIQPFVPVSQLDYKTIDKVLKVNLYGLINMTKSFLPYLLERSEAQIVNVSSMGGFFPFRGQTLYGASKAAVKLFTEGLYVELQDTSVKVTLVFPGAIDTQITENSGVEMDLTSARTKVPFQPLAPQKAAQQIVRGMEREKYQVFVGADSKAMNLLYRLTPKGAVQWMNRLMNAVIPA